MVRSGTKNQKPGTVTELGKTADVDHGTEFNKFKNYRPCRNDYRPGKLGPVTVEQRRDQFAQGVDEAFHTSILPRATDIQTGDSARSEMKNVLSSGC